MTIRKGTVICVTGIDTDIGKTIVTGLLARYLAKKGVGVITQKLCQTGCDGSSEDILTHREIMGTALLDEDKNGLTCPYVFKEPCSPHLAAELEKTVIDTERITAATDELRAKYEFVVLEGVGGLMVPLTSQHTLIDYLKGLDYWHILVSSTRLGSINHTLSSLELMSSRRLDLKGIVYNMFFQSSDFIRDDSRKIFKTYLRQYGYPDKIADMHSYRQGSSVGDGDCVNFDLILRDLI